MSLRPAQAIKLKRFIAIVLAWVFCGLMISIYDHFSLHARTSLGPSDYYSFRASLLFNTSSGLIGGLLGGSFLVYYVNEKLRDRSYGKTLLSVAISFIVIVSIITVVLGFLFIRYHIGAFPYTDAEATRFFEAYLVNPIHAKNMVIWSFITLLTQFTLQMDDKFGRGMLWNFIKGKYQTPQHEERVFMFIDLKGSTSIAESLGNDEYYIFLKDFFSDITKSIVDNAGMIYQYVGDEVVISWTTESALYQAQCLKCFFDAKQKLEQLVPKYEKKFGHVPRFKASLHYGKVTAGEIGVMKRDVTYSGDVLNTTARIIAQCNSYGADLLISGIMKDRLKAHEHAYAFEHKGDIELRGKSVKNGIYAVSLV